MSRAHLAMVDAAMPRSGLDAFHEAADAAERAIALLDRLDDRSTGSSPTVVERVHRDLFARAERATGTLGTAMGEVRMHAKQAEARREAVRARLEALRFTGDVGALRRTIGDWDDARAFAEAQVVEEQEMIARAEAVTLREAHRKTSGATERFHELEARWSARRRTP